MTKGNIDFNEIKLVPASLKNYPTIQTMARYVYDMSQYLGNEDGSWKKLARKNI